jgi:hypothetical protein
MLKVVRPGTLVLLAGWLALGAGPVFGDDLLKNEDFKAGSQMWHGDGHVVYVKPDGTEGGEDDPGVVPAMKIALERYQAHAVYQELNTKPVLASVQVSVEVFASADFKRVSVSDSVVVDSGSLMMHDFVIRVNPDLLESGSDLKPGEWTKTRATFDLLHAAGERGIYFLVPPGYGYVYLRNLSVTP